MIYIICPKIKQSRTGSSSKWMYPDRATKSNNKLWQARNFWWLLSQIKSWEHAWQSRHNQDQRCLSPML